MLQNSREHERRDDRAMPTDRKGNVNVANSVAVLSHGKPPQRRDVGYPLEQRLLVEEVERPVECGPSPTLALSAWTMPRAIGAMATKMAESALSPIPPRSPR